ncbi:ABC-type transport system involved in multi-copper enzyme maturation permease subunit [Oikeobacillus pervagus]|uniref:ABC-type transport system involved in multi-copper enzyme maturation permease subunit n=1 Tax=Oikeobacillus pervagus TaxID=1325931 RepID=A0AAJ1SWQ1_9BACI|nr:ABC-2 transporter permease [Oikeobacillus pervagus]MDQ0214019.1 ABC-type transport system involved in multi-copper enzyme maturation permease subunit [Oikeobacillus pervagus]
MYHLIKKDILMQKKAIKLSVLLIIFFTFTLSNIGPAGLTIGVLAITYQLALGASALEDKNNSDIILMSLPIKRTIIVLSKYVSIYIYAAYAILGFYLVNLIINLLNLRPDIPFNFTGLIGAIIAVTLFCSISFPLIFKYGFIKAKMANLIIFFVFVFGGTGLVSYLSENNKLMLSQDIMTFLSNGSDIVILIISMVLLLLILICSYFISLTFYRKREF